MKSPKDTYGKFRGEMDSGMKKQVWEADKEWLQRLWSLIARPTTAAMLKGEVTAEVAEMWRWKDSQKDATTNRYSDVVWESLAWHVKWAEENDKAGECGARDGILELLRRRLDEMTGDPIPKYRVTLTDRKVLEGLWDYVRKNGGIRPALKQLDRHFQETEHRVPKTTIRDTLKKHKLPLPKLDPGREKKSNPSI